MPPPAYKPRWKCGTFPTGALKPRMHTLLLLLEERAAADRDAGRLVLADAQDELVEVIGEYIRILENSVRAARQTIKAMEAIR